MVEVLGVGWALRRALFDSFVGIVLFDSFVGIVLFDSFSLESKNWNRVVSFVGWDMGRVSSSRREYLVDREARIETFSHFFLN